MQKAKDFFLQQLQKRKPSESKNQENKIEDQSIRQEILNEIKEDHFDASNFNRIVHIYSHLDADGLSSAAILARTLQRANIGFQISILRQLENEVIQNIQNEIHIYYRFIIFSDFGSGQIDLLKKTLNLNDFLILDHHTPVANEQAQEVNHINPYFFGIEGSNELSGAGVCYFFALAMNPKNIDLSPIALVGATGDLQNKGVKGTFQGTNLKVLEDAQSIGKIQIETDIAISRTRPISQAIAFTLPENLPGISGDEEQARRFLEANNIKTTNELHEPRTLLDLTQLEKVSLNKALINYAINEKQLGIEFTKKLVTTVFILKDYDPKSPFSDIREMSSLLNACGRRGHPSLGIATLLGDQQALQEALAESKNYKKSLATAVEYALQHIVKHKNFVSFYGGLVIDEKIIGTIASMLIYSDKIVSSIILAYAESDLGTYKVSARTRNKTIDLSIVMREVSQKMQLDTSAGGHPPAAGAKIPQNRLKEFLVYVDEALGQQLEKAKKGNSIGISSELKQSN